MLLERSREEAARKHSLKGRGLAWFWSRSEMTSVQGDFQPEQRQVGWRDAGAMEAVGQHARAGADGSYF